MSDRTDMHTVAMVCVCVCVCVCAREKEREIPDSNMVISDARR